MACGFSLEAELCRFCVSSQSSTRRQASEEFFDSQRQTKKAGGRQVCENAQKPSGFLMVKIGELERLGFKVSGFKLRAGFGIQE